MKKMLIAIVCIIVAIPIGVYAFVHSKPFGSLPKGERLERVLNSPNYRDGAFRNEEPTTLMVQNEEGARQGRFKTMWNFVFGKKPEGRVPQEGEVTVVKSDLRGLDPQEDVYVWLGHSSYLLQLSGKTFLVDPVFYQGSPVSFVNRMFPGTDYYKPEHMPEVIDYLVITHDHWDHLDYRVVKELRTRVRHVVCGLGVGAHFERWGYAPEQLIELDWNEEAPLGEYQALTPDSTEARVVCLPTRHFSGRGLKSNQSLWASFMLETPSLRVFVGGDGGYDGRFKRIGERFPVIDLAILENGQYDKRWAQIHTLPEQLGKEMTEMGARRYITVHHSKFCLANHPWKEPLENEKNAAQESGKELVVCQIGEIVKL